MTEPAAIYMAPDQLVPWGKNPRVNDHAVNTVAGLIQRFGWGAPILARRENLMVIGGHTRLKAATKLGLAEVPVRLMDLSQEEAEALALADNKAGELANWDNEQLATILADLERQEFDLEELGFSDAELEKLVGEAELEDVPVQEIPPRYDVLVVCGDEAKQLALIAKLQEEGLECQALMS